MRDTLVGHGFGLSDAVAGKLLAFARGRARGPARSLALLDSLGGGDDAFEAGRLALRETIAQLQALGVPDARYGLNLSIARGLDYYTGIVYETTLDAHPQIGSICSGGRYEDLASHYTRSKLPGVGISIGLTRLFWQLREAGIVAVGEGGVDVLVGLLDDAGLGDALALSQALRAVGLRVETQLEPRKLARQLQYADKAGIRFVAIRGEQETARGEVTLKDLRSGAQHAVALADAPMRLKEALE